MLQVLAVAAVNLDGAVAGDKTLDAVAINGIAAPSQFVVDALDVVPDSEYVIISVFLSGRRLLEDKFVSTAAAGGLDWLGECFILLNDVVHIENIFLDVGIELKGGFVTHLLDDSCQSGIIGFYFAVLEASLQSFPCQLRLASPSLINGVLDFVAGAACDSDF